MPMTRLKHDQYFTPKALVDPLLEILDLSKDVICFEPCAGDSAIANQLPVVIKADIDPELGHLVFDATNKNAWESVVVGYKPDWVITNPPYSQPDCDRIIQNAWDFTEEGVAMLLRLSYLEPCKGRAKFLKEAALSSLIIFNPRPQFIPAKKSTDSSTVAWFVWRKDWADQTQIIYCTNWHE